MQPVSSISVDDKLHSIAVLLTSTRSSLNRVEKSMDALATNVTALQSSSKDIQMYQRNSPTKQFINYALNNQLRNQQPVYALMQGSSMIQNSSNSSSLKDVPASCTDVPGNKTGVYRIKTFVESPSTFYANCDLQTDGHKWTVILNREDGEINFYRNWIEYKNGFGNVFTEFWIGLDKLREVIFSINKSHAILSFSNYIIIDNVIKTSSTVHSYGRF